MYSHSHFIASLVIGELFVSFGLLTHWHALLAGVLAVAIDLDHLVHHALATGQWSPTGAWNAATASKNFNYRTWFHRWQGWLSVFGLTLIVYNLDIRLAITIGMAYLSHLLLDLYDFLPVSKRPFIQFTIAGLVFRLTLPETVFDVLMLIVLILAVV